MTILITGGAGFIGSNFVLEWVVGHDEQIVNLDKLTYAGNRHNLASLENNPKHIFKQGDIGDSHLVAQLLADFQPRAVINMAAESHVDRSIDSPEEFIQTNVVATFQLLACVKEYWQALTVEARRQFRFLHVSTDEVYGSLADHEPPFSEQSCYQPNSPYAASKAASDHWVRAYFHTYDLPVLTAHCSNNYGPYQFPEKLIPLTIHNALTGAPIPLYGNGLQVRDWLYVTDHCRALRSILQQGQIGACYNIGGCNEKSNLEVVKTICALLDQQRPQKGDQHYAEQITFIKDRPGHDQRYAINASKIEQALGWRPQETFETGLHKTIQWYLNNPVWLRSVTSGAYREWIGKQYAL